MRSLLLLVVVLCLSGCAVTNINTKHQDGKQIECRAYSYSLFTATDTANLSACGGKSNTAGAKVDAAMAGELLKALVGVP